MPRDVLSFRAGPNRSSRTAGLAPNVAFHARELFRRLSASLAAARPFRDACQTLERRATGWGVPPTFFLTGKSVGERRATPPREIADAVAVAAARQCPHGAVAWASLNDLLDDAFTACAAERSVRRAARAVPDLRERLAEFAGDHRGCAEFAALLAVTDDFVVTAIHPAAEAGFRVRLHGIVDLDQFHVLLADAVAGSPVRGYLAGARPDPAVVEACRDQPADGDSIATARFQFLRPTALRADGTVPAGFAGTDHWLWGHESPRIIPDVDGERILLLADAVYPRQWMARRRFPALDGALELMNVLSRDQVGTWIAQRTGRRPTERIDRRAA